MTSVIAHPPSPTRSPRSRPSPGEDENHTNEITPACLASSQAEKVIVVPSLSEMRDKSLSEFGALRTVSMERHARRPGVTLRRPGVTLRSGSSAWDGPTPARGRKQAPAPGGSALRDARPPPPTPSSDASWKPPARSPPTATSDRKSTRLNSSHGSNSYAVF